MRQIFSTMDITKEKEELIEMFGIHFESLYHLPPLAARILGNLIIGSSKSGLTFEDLVERTVASKSSVSTNLNFLLKIGKITYYTLPGDRKKYFKPAPFSERMTNYLKIMEFEKQLIDRMIAYSEKTAVCPQELINLENCKLYKAHILEMEQLTIKAVNKFKEVENRS